MARLNKRDIDELKDVDIDDLLSKLSEAEIEELGQELIDPDDSCIPPAERCRYKCDKAPTGKYNRKALLDYLEKRAKEEKDWEENKPYMHEIRGKVFKPKVEEKIQINDDEDVETEWDEVLANATDEELVDLAAILGFHGMLNQVQYHQAFVEQKDNSEVQGGFQGVAKHENFKMFEAEKPNDTDVDAALTSIKDNDPKLKELNLNNIKNISVERLKEFGLALKTNTNLESFSLANTKLTDRAAKAFAEGLADNKTLRSLNMESNYVSGQCIVEILEAIAVHKGVIEFRVSNQRPALLGCKVETKIAELIEQNFRLLKFGIFLETKGPQVRVREYIQRNNDRVRKDRVGQPMEAEPEYQPPEKPKRRSEVLKAAEAAEAPKKKEEAAKKEESEEEESEEESEEEESDEE